MRQHWQGLSSPVKPVALPEGQFLTLSLFSPVQVLHTGELTSLSPIPRGITTQPSCRAGSRLPSAFHPACSAVPRNADSGDVLVLVDSEDDEEGKGSEEALSSCTEHEAMALVGGSRAQAAHLNHVMEGEQPPVPAQLWAFPEQLREGGVPDGCCS